MRALFSTRGSSQFLLLAQCFLSLKLGWTPLIMTVELWTKCRNCHSSYIQANRVHTAVKDATIRTYRSDIFARQHRVPTFLSYVNSQRRRLTLESSSPLTNKMCRHQVTSPLNIAYGQSQFSACMILSFNRLYTDCCMCAYTYKLSQIEFSGLFHLQKENASSDLFHLRVRLSMLMGSAFRYSC